MSLKRGSKISEHVPSGGENHVGAVTRLGAGTGGSLSTVDAYLR